VLAAGVWISALFFPTRAVLAAHRDKLAGAAARA